jgi:hypothetical protein
MPKQNRVLTFLLGSALVLIGFTSGSVLAPHAVAGGEDHLSNISKTLDRLTGHLKDLSRSVERPTVCECKCSK